MPQMETLHDAFLDELRDVYDAERQLTRALPRLAKAASSNELRSAFEEHLEQTKGHIERLERVFESLDQRARGKRCTGMAGIIEEGKNAMQEDVDGAIMDAMLIAEGQRTEHYEIAAYGALAAWAKAMGHEEAARLLHETLDEEKQADEKLSRLAEGRINEEAAKMKPGDGEMRQRGRSRSGRTAASGSRSRASRSRPTARRKTTKARASRS